MSREAARAAAAVIAVGAAVVLVAVGASALRSTPAPAPAAAVESTPTPPPPPASAPTVEGPVGVVAPGWTCEVPADQKFACWKGDAVVVVTWRASEERAAYLHPAKADVLRDVHTFVSEAHGPYFATVTPVDAQQTDVDEVGAALSWVD